jgi:hypothetical protein
MTQSEKQKERGKLSPARYNRKLARTQWRAALGEMFLFRGRLPSCPSFRDFIQGARPKSPLFNSKSISETV